MDLRFDCPPKVQTKVRTKWTKAAMPGPRNLHQNQAIVLLLTRSQSAPPKSSRSRPTEYPWEAKITPPPPRKKEANADPRDEEAFQRILRALRLEADRRYGVHKQEDAQKNAMAREEAAAKRAAAAEAQRRADADTITEAVQRALDKARLQPPKTATELATLEKEQGEKRAAMGATATQLEASRDSTLKLKLGHAIARRNLPTAALMRLWDTNGDGDLSKEEFMQALKRTLDMKIESSNIKDMSDLFDSFDVDRNGSVTINELQPAVARLHEDCRDEALKEKLSRLKVAVYDLELAKLKDCLDVAQEWESILKQRSELKSRHTVVENLGMLLSEKVDRAKNKKFIKGSGNAVTPEYLAGELAGEGSFKNKKLSKGSGNAVTPEYLAGELAGEGSFKNKKLSKGSGNAVTPEYLAGELAGEGSFKNKKLSKGSGNAVTPEYLAGELAGEGGMVSRTSFMKFAVRRHRHRTLVRSPLLLCAHAWCRRVLTA